jgi:5-methylcytosine-specific restriction endonuclease McrA
MPVRAPSVCSLCRKAHLSGDECALIAARNRARKAKHDAKRPSRQARGYDAEWDKARADYLAAYPSCRRCGAKANLVDHIIPIRKAPHRRLDRTNFQALCTACHSGWKQSQDKRTQ